MNRKLVMKQIENSSLADLESWRKHAIKCLNYYKKYRNDFEIDECQFVIKHIDHELNKRLGSDPQCVNALKR